LRILYLQSATRTPVKSGVTYSCVVSLTGDPINPDVNPENKVGVQSIVAEAPPMRLKHTWSILLPRPLSQALFMP
jgi:hypothetical protein